MDPPGHSEYSGSSTKNATHLLSLASTLTSWQLHQVSMVMLLTLLFSAQMFPAQNVEHCNPFQELDPECSGLCGHMLLLKSAEFSDM